MKREIKGPVEKLVIYLISVGIGFLVTFIIMLGFSVISVVGDLDEGFATPFASISAAVGSLISAFFASRRIGSGGLLNGLICGGVMFVITLLVSLWLDKGGLTVNTLFNLIIMLLSGLIGGIWGVNQKQKKII